MSLTSAALHAVAPYAIPSPSQGVWHVLGFPLRGYALCIILGIIVAIVIGERRWVARGGRAGEVQDLAVWAVPFGLVGGRLYHVITDHDLYFGPGRHPIEALYVWRGGLGIWGAIALGMLGVWIGARRKGIKLPAFVDALAPGVIIAQGIGRWGNWFNQELYGRPTSLPWGLKISPEHWQCDVNHHAESGPLCGAAPPDGAGYTDATLFHPTFLYESIWNLLIAGLLVWADRRFKLGHGRVLALYVMGYTLGRGWIESLRVDNVELENVLGLRLNVWTSIVLFVAAAIGLVISARRHPGREASVYRDGYGPDAEPSDGPDGPDGPAADQADDETGDQTDDETGDQTGDEARDADPGAVRMADDGRPPPSG